MSHRIKTIGRRLTLLVLVVLLLTTLALPAYASGSGTTSTTHAEQLHMLHLFQGTGTKVDGTPVYSLDTEPTRLHGLVMLIRLLGREDEALKTAASNPFADVNAGHDAYGIPYVAYAYDSGLTQGRSATVFDPDTALAARDYVTFLLRALGYDDAAGDFSWAQALPFAASIGMMTPGAADQLAALTLNRGDMVDLSYAALGCTMKDGKQTLAEKLCAEGIFTREEGEQAGVLGRNAGWVYVYEPYVAPVRYERRTVSTSVGAVTAHVITVNARDDRVTVRSAMVDNTLGHTAAFSSIVAGSGGAVAVINGNFFNSYDAFQDPIGHVMVNGTFLQAISGLSSLGIEKNGTVSIGRLPVFTRITGEGANIWWDAYEVNSAKGQGDYTSVLYTPAYGGSVTFNVNAYAMIVSNSVITDYRAVSAGESVTIPSNGFVFYMGSLYAAEAWVSTPAVGTRITSVAPYLRDADTADSFSLDDVVSIVSGSPRLVKDGQIVYDLDSGFQEARFTTMSTPRTAVGINSAGELLLVSVPSATIQQMRELMAGLGCVDAINLDGGGSCAMYYNGQYLATPGRNLTTTLQVFCNG